MKYNAIEGVLLESNGAWQLEKDKKIMWTLISLTKQILTLISVTTLVLFHQRFFSKTS